MIRKRTFKGKKIPFCDYKITLRQGDHCLSDKTNLPQIIVQKNSRTWALNSGTAPIHRSFVLETPASSCHAQYLIGILTLQITQHLLLRCSLETPFVAQEFKGALFTDTQDSRMPLCSQLPVQSGDKTSASQYEKLSHLHILTKSFNRFKTTNGWSRGGEELNSPAWLL